MTGNPPATLIAQSDVIREILNCTDNALRYVQLAFPWGEKDTPLENHEGPDAWQCEVLNLLSSSRNIDYALQIAVASGHGVGKGALCAWMILWFMSTRQNPQIVVTANTGTQLNTKTWRELSKWHQLAINKNWFRWTATKFAFIGRESTWFALASTWSEHRTEAFAGLHEGSVMVVFDEASIIPKLLWDVAKGAMTTKECIWVALGNPTQSSGMFYNCFHGLRHRWRTFHVDSRKAKMVNKAEIERTIEDEGLDSDYVRVRILGQFPRTASNQLIGFDIIDGAVNRTVETHPSQAIVMGVDVAAQGDDQTVVTIRQGYKILKIYSLRKSDGMEVADFISFHYNEHQPDSCFIDADGMGAIIFDRLKQLGYTRIIPVKSGLKGRDPDTYLNLRIEMWIRVKEWLKLGDIPKEQQLIDDLTVAIFDYDAKHRMLLLAKKKMKSLGLASPDFGDSLAYTFAYPVHDDIVNRDRQLNHSSRFAELSEPADHWMLH